MIRRLAIPTLALAVLTACADTEPVDPCVAHPTSTNILGQCVEADGEPCDSDPCDAVSDWDWKTPGPAPSQGIGKKPTSKPKTTGTKSK